MTLPAIPEHIRQAAYEMWCLRAGRSPKLTAELLKEDDIADIAPGTIAVWAGRYNWAEKYMDDMERSFPFTRRETAANLVVAGVQASRQLVAHFHGQKIPKGDEKLIFGALDRAGFSPVGNNDRVAGVSPSQIQQSTLIEKLLSPEERAAIAAESQIREENDATEG